MKVFIRHLYSPRSISARVQLPVCVLVHIEWLQLQFKVNKQADQHWYTCLKLTYQQKTKSFVSKSTSLSRPRDWPCKVLFLSEDKPIYLSLQIGAACLKIPPERWHHISRKLPIPFRRVVGAVLWFASLCLLVRPLYTAEHDFVVIKMDYLF